MAQLSEGSFITRERKGRPVVEKERREGDGAINKRVVKGAKWTSRGFMGGRVCGYWEKGAEGDEPD